MATIDRDRLRDIFVRTMKVNRTDETFRALLMQGKVAVMYYCVRGQELVSAAAMAALHRDDYVVCTYRGQGEQTAKGIPIAKWWGECLGKVTGTCKGKGGTMHITDPATGIMVTTGVVGSGLPIATGLALASQNTGDGRVTLVSFGDGAANTGAFHEAMNLAALWRLPVVFLCQNNRYGEHTAFADHTASTSIASRAAGYGMPGVVVDGQDVVAVHETVQAAVERARAGEGPSLVECKTYRFRAHVEGVIDIAHADPRSQEEIDAWKQRDPIKLFGERLLEQNILSQADIEQIDAEAANEMEEADRFASESPEIEATILDEALYAG